MPFTVMINLHTDLESNILGYSDHLVLWTFAQNFLVSEGNLKQMGFMLKAKVRTDLSSDFICTQGRANQLWHHLNI